MESSIIFTTMLAAFVTGLASSLHCLGMCGGAMSAMMLTAKPRAVQNAIVKFPLSALTATARASSGVPIESAGAFAAEFNLALIFSFNAGRILSYSLAGAIVGEIGSVGNAAGAWLVRDAMPMRLTIFIVANIVILLTGLSIAGWTRGLAPLERMGTKLWQKIAPFTRGLLPVKSAAHAGLLGALWGWIPCGLVYAMLVVAWASGSAINGAASMLAFGLGTLPIMTAAGLLSTQIKGWLRHKRLRLLAGAAVIFIALIGLNRVPVMAGLGEHATLTAMCHSALSNAIKTPP